MNTTDNTRTGKTGQLLPMATINKVLLHNAEYVLNEWLDGKLSGNEFKAINPTRNDASAGSFSTNIVSGTWADFATDDKGGDLASLYCYLNNTSEQEAVVELKAFINTHGLTETKRKNTGTVTSNRTKPPTEPINEADLGELPPDSHPKKGMVVEHWEWRNPDNDIVFYTARVEPEPNKKEVLPVRYITSENRWHWSYPAGKLPLLNAPDIDEGVRVIFSEGEKTCSHLSQFKEFISTTSAGGSGRLFETDLAPLQNVVSVTVFPDADQPGAKYAAQVMAYCMINEISVRVLDVSAMGWSGGQDAADFPSIVWSEYESHIINPDAWTKLSPWHRTLFDDAVMLAAAQMTPVDYDRVKAHIADVLGIGKRTLDSEVKKLIKLDVETEITDEPEMSPEDLEAYRQSIYADISHIAEARDILAKVVSFANDTLGLVGEHNLVKTTYLTLSSRLLPKPISTVVKGASSSGKSHTTGQVTSMFPDNAYYQFTAASSKALIYTEEDFQNRILIIAEASQLNGSDDDDMMSMLIRTLLSEGIIKYEVTVKDPLTNEQATRVITKEGPTGLLLTTTADAIHHENETRMLSIFSDESETQTRNIVRHAAFAEANPHINEDIEDLLELWRKFHDWVSLGNHKVAIPFMPEIIETIERMPVRFRRDLKNTLPALIKSSTIIHQQHRETNEHGYLVATLDDYANIRGLADTALAREADVSGSPREVTILKHIYELMPVDVRNGKGSLTVSTREISKALGIPQKTVLFQINKTIEHGYLKNVELVPKRAMKLKLGADFDLGKIQPDEILPVVEQVRKLVEKT